MKNEEKFKTPEERQKAFEAYCDEQKSCRSCPIDEMHRNGYCACEFIWQSLEYQEPKQDLPFKVDVGRTTTAIRRTDTQEVIFSENHMIYKNALEISHRKCDQLNAAALAWHERMKEEGK